MFRAYVLRSEKTQRFYIGSCEHLEAHVWRHNAGQNPATKHGRPWILVYSEELETRAEAVRRERFFKTGRGREEFQKLIGAGKPVTVSEEVSAAGREQP